MVTTHSKEMILTEMPGPTKQTLFVNLVEFIPGTDDTLSSVDSHSRTYNQAPSSRTPPLPSDGNGSHCGPSPTIYTPPAVIHPPPPPWSRWATPTLPLPTNHRRHHEDAVRPLNQPPFHHTHVSRKRKHEDIILQPSIDESSRVSASTSLQPPSKRRGGPASGSVTPISPPSRSLPPVSPSPHPNQTLSPSLRKLMADSTPDVPAPSPRAPFNIPPIRQNGNDSRSPTLPSVKSLMSGMPS